MPAPDFEHYHRNELRRLLEHVRDGLAALDAGSIDEFEMDELLHRYMRAAAALWKFCNRSRAQFRATAADRVAAGDGPDWWAESAPAPRRSSTTGEGDF